MREVMSVQTDRMEKDTRGLSGPLFRYLCRRNLILWIVILVVFCFFTGVTNAAAHLISVDRQETVSEETRDTFFEYLGILAAYDRMAGAELSYDDYITQGADREAYQEAFDLYDRNQDVPQEEAHSTEKLDAVIEEMDALDFDPGTYVRLFEYAYVLQDSKGVFTGEDLELSDMTDLMFAAMGMSREDLDRMQTIDFTVMITRVYFTAMGVLILFLFVIIAANGAIAGQVDAGSMAYLLSAPNRRRAVCLTSILYLVAAPLAIMTVACLIRIGSTKVLFGEVVPERIVMLYVGMYLLVQAIAGICFFFSCHFNESRKSLGAGGGFAVWCFLASLLGMFGTKDLIDMGIGVEALGVFNKLTLVSLFDIGRIQTIGTDSVDTGFLTGFAALFLIALTAYTAGVIRFRKKDLPL